MLKLKKRGSNIWSVFNKRFSFDALIFNEENGETDCFIRKCILTSSGKHILAHLQLVVSEV